MDLQILNMQKYQIKTLLQIKYWHCWDVSVTLSFVVLGSINPERVLLLTFHRIDIKSRGYEYHGRPKWKRNDNFGQFTVSRTYVPKWTDSCSETSLSFLFYKVFCTLISECMHVCNICPRRCHCTLPTACTGPCHYPRKYTINA